MPSSTSSFKTYEIERIIPRHPWLRLAGMTLGITLLLTLGWEIYCRQQGYAPTLNDTADLWASRRAVLDQEPDRTVLIGASRMLFDFNMDIYEQAMGERPLQLASVGTNPGPYLEDLANHPKFKGTVIVGVVPGLFFAPGGPPIHKPQGNLKRYREWSPTQKGGHHLSIVLENRLAFLQQEDLTMNQLLLSLDIPNRPAARVPPKLPPYFYEVDEERQGGMTDFAERDSGIQKRIQQIWLPLFTPPPFPPGLSESEIHAKVQQMADDVLQATKQRVAKIRKRGGKVVFVRFPSTGGLRELENKITPRAAYWDRLLEVTGAPGIHFEDHPELSGYDCPEWSHLTKSDAAEFTRRLTLIFKKLRAAGSM
ncbi:MAG: hypothetical protein GWM98_23210 [Nitrospinaceae bacterium]|nr:hypothetical protein [Nitrospinaceae bacterium]NIR56833.1 hypothetical protein [Nitrospinaceae bacterium]NIS87300.1 hypothetical protein [Nitrospinaceae bacterium]NIT84153.1 hypothetical protein [Nitrospinaceae bacterium]NIU46340.1 hypothetical protein [Nitrospinaceae bacterium]